MQQCFIRAIKKLDDVGNVPRHRQLALYPAMDGGGRNAKAACEFTLADSEASERTPQLLSGH
jgi:hypothetical protein